MSSVMDKTKLQQDDLTQERLAIAKGRIREKPETLVTHKTTIKKREGQKQDTATAKEATKLEARAQRQSIFHCTKHPYTHVLCLWPDTCILERRPFAPRLSIETHDRNHRELGVEHRP